MTQGDLVRDAASTRLAGFSGDFCLVWFFFTHAVCSQGFSAHAGSERNAVPGAEPRQSGPGEAGGVGAACR